MVMMMMISLLIVIIMSVLLLLLMMMMRRTRAATTTAASHVQRRRIVLAVRAARLTKLREYIHGIVGRVVNVVDELELRFDYLRGAYQLGVRDVKKIFVVVVVVDGAGCGCTATGRTRMCSSPRRFLHRL